MSALTNAHACSNSRILPVQADMRENSCPRPQQSTGSSFPVLPVQSATSENSCQQPFKSMCMQECVFPPRLGTMQKSCQHPQQCGCMPPVFWLAFSTTNDSGMHDYSCQGPHQSNDSQQAFESECAGICTGQKLLASSVVHLYEANLLGSLCDQCLRLAAGLLLTMPAYGKPAGLLSPILIRAGPSCSANDPSQLCRQDSLLGQEYDFDIPWSEARFSVMPGPITPDIECLLASSI